MIVIPETSESCSLTAVRCCILVSCEVTVTETIFVSPTSKNRA